MVKHLTLTVRNDLDLPAMVKHLVASFRRFRQRKLFKAAIIGGAFVIELTNTGNGWHAHIHAVVQSYRVKWSDLRDLWYKCSRGSTGIYLQNIPPVEAVRYLTKYIAQCDLSVDNQQIASDTLRNYRLFNPFGEWYAINKEYIKPTPVCGICKEPGTTMPLFLFKNECMKFMDSS